MENINTKIKIKNMSPKLKHIKQIQLQKKRITMKYQRELTLITIKISMIKN